MKKNAFFLILLCSFLLSVWGCSSSIEKTLGGVESTAAAGTDESLDEEGADYRISPKDVLEIKVYPDETLNREVTVNRDGTIQFPLLEDVQVRGLSIRGLEKKMGALLEKDFLVNPQVHIRVKGFHTTTISIMGEVNRPGPYELETDEGQTTLLEAIAKAGGFSQLANPRRVKIVRIEGGEKRVYKVNAEAIIKGRKKDVMLKGNDIVVIEQSWF